MRRSAVGAAGLLVGLLVAPRAAGAQAAVARADSLLRLGLVTRAEALYYAAAHRAPRDPAPRFALAGYLASRGALRVAAVLVEEARRFGGDPATAAALLAPMYAGLQDFAALVRLEGARLPAGELARARWLVPNPPTFSAPDSVRLPLGAGPPGTLGSVVLVLGGDTLRAEVDPSAHGLVLDRRQARTPGVRAFDAGASATQPAVVATVRLGPILIRNAPAELDDLGDRRRARVGLDWLARWAPTFDARDGRTLILRRAGLVPDAVARRARRRVVLLYSLPGMSGVGGSGPWIVVPGAVVRLAGAEVTRLRTARVTLDPRRGELLVED